MKRVFDMVVTIVALVVLLPVMAVIAMLVKLDSQGPVLYSGMRVGLDGKHFTMHKLRTMATDAARQGGSSTADSDPRITGVGRWLRKWKLDELPQILNVLKGDMSFVGPRPDVPEYGDALLEGENREILSVRPGITDWASLWNVDEGKRLSKAEDPDKMYREEIRPTKLALQRLYVHNHSFLGDLKIIWYTMRKIVNSGFVPKELEDYLAEARGNEGKAKS